MDDWLLRLGRNAVAVLLGLSTSYDAVPLPPGRLNDTLVFGNVSVFGNVNSAPVHFRTAAEALAKADQEWLRRLITRRVPLSNWQQALAFHDDIKVVVELTK